jgi:hypothetical protein
MTKESAGGYGSGAEVVMTILGRRGGSLSWYTRNTGGLELPGGSRVHFGLNDKDLVTVFASDIARLPEWQRQIWVGFNVAPDGGVSRELLSAQVEAAPASTQAPEQFLERGLTELNAAFHSRWGMALFKRHEATTEILSRVHRFRALDEAGLLSLAKDLARLTADSLDLGALHQLVPAAKTEKLRTLKSLERLLATLTDAADARRIIEPLVGVYQLRLGDAHMPSAEIAGAFAVLGLDRNASSLQQGTQLLHATVSAIYRINEILVRTPAPASGNVPLR